MNTGRIAALICLIRWLNLAEVAEGMVAYRFSSAKTHIYLRRKAERLAQRNIYGRFPGLTKMLAKDGLIGLEATDEGAASKGEPGEKAFQEEARLEFIREGELILFAKRCNSETDRLVLCSIL